MANDEENVFNFFSQASTDNNDTSTNNNITNNDKFTDDFNDNNVDIIDMDNQNESKNNINNNISSKESNINVHNISVDLNRANNSVESPYAKYLPSQAKKSHSNLREIPQTPEDSPKHSPKIKSRRRNLSNYKQPSFDLRNHPIINQFEITINDLRNDNDQISNENEELKQKIETLKITNENQVQELELRLKEAKFESHEYKSHYDVIMEEVMQLRGQENEINVVTKDKNETLLQLQNAQKRETELAILNDKLANENEQLQTSVKKYQEQTKQLNTILLQMKQQKNKLERQVNKLTTNLEMQEQEQQIILEDLENQLEQQIEINAKLEREYNEARKANLDMQTQMTEQTLELLHDDINASHNDDPQRTSSKPLRLMKLNSQDFDNNKTGHINKMSQMSEDFNGNNIIDDDENKNFIGNRYDSNINIAMENLNDLANESHRRGLSLDSMASRRSVIDTNGGVSAEQMNKYNQELHDQLIKSIKIIVNKEINDNIDVEQTIKNIMPNIIQENTKNIIQENIDNINNNNNNDSNDDDNNDDDSKNTEEIINAAIDRSKTMIIDNLQESLKQVIDNQSNTQDIQNTISNGLENIYGKLSSNDNIKDTISQSIESGMSVMQLALENTIDKTFVNTIERSIKSQMESNSLKDNIVTDIANEIENVKQLIVDNNENNNNGNQNNKSNEQFLEDLQIKVENLLDKSMQKTIQGRIDTFMDDFRKEVVPDFQALIETNIKNNINNIDNIQSNRTNVPNDDEKYDENKNELIAKIDELSSQINTLNNDNKILQKNN